MYENRRRVEALGLFRNVVVSYFNSLKQNDQWMSINDIVDTPGSTVLRQKINLQIESVGDIILAAGQRALFLHRDAPASGGRQTTIDLLQNIFLLLSLEIPPQNLLDTIERTAGVYENDFRSARRRTFNPLFWLGLALDGLASIPFRLLGKLGFNRRKVEDSVFGRIIKAVLYLITVIAAFLTVMDLLGYISSVKKLVASIIGAA